MITGKRDNVSPRARWRVSDIVRTVSGDKEADFVADSFARWMWSMEIGLRMLNVTLPRVCGVRGERWDRMTHEERCDALVATARRLNVPRRG